MITQSDNKIETYQVFGEVLRINFNETEIKIKNIDNTEKTAYQYDYAVSHPNAKRGDLISDIIRGKYSISNEFAVINNAQNKPEEYSSYQAFRLQAKALADGWINK